MNNITIMLSDFICKGNQHFTIFNIVIWTLAGIGLIALFFWLIKFIPYDYPNAK